MMPKPHAHTCLRKRDLENWADSAILHLGTEYGLIPDGWYDPDDDIPRIRAAERRGMGAPEPTRISTGDDGCYVEKGTMR